MPVVKKRKRVSEARTISGRATKKRGIVKLVAAQIAANNKKFMEVKMSVATNNDNVEILHNNFVTLDTNPLSTSQGVTAPSASFQNNRIGDKINLRGLSIKMMVELNERYSTEGAPRALTFENFCQDLGLPARARIFIPSTVLPQAHPKHAFSKSPLYSDFT